MSAFPYLYCRRPRRAWQPPALHRASAHSRYRERRPVAGVEAREHWQKRAFSRWLAGGLAGAWGGWLRLRGDGW